MNSLYLLIPIALIFLALVVYLFVWAVGSGQYDDLDRESSRILFDEDSLPDPEQEPEQEHSKAKQNDG